MKHLIFSFLMLVMSTQLSPGVHEDYIGPDPSTIPPLPDGWVKEFNDYHCDLTYRYNWKGEYGQEVSYWVRAWYQGFQSPKQKAKGTIPWYNFNKFGKTMIEKCSSEELRVGLGLKAKTYKKYDVHHGKMSGYDVWTIKRRQNGFLDSSKGKPIIHVIIHKPGETGWVKVSLICFNNYAMGFDPDWQLKEKDYHCAQYIKTQTNQNHIDGVKRRYEKEKAELVKHYGASMDQVRQHYPIAKGLYKNFISMVLKERSISDKFDYDVFPPVEDGGPQDKATNPPMPPRNPDSDPKPDPDPDPAPKRDLTDDQKKSVQLVEKASELMKQKDKMEDAKKLLYMAVALDQNNPTAYHKMGNCYYTENKFDGAVKLWHKSLELKPGDLKVMFNLGQGYRRLGKWQQSIDYYTRCIEKDAQDVRYFERRALVHSLRNDYHKAIADYEQALKIDPKDPSSIRGLALVKGLAKPAENQATTHACSGCQKTISRDSKFCQHCGQKQ